MNNIYSLGMSSNNDNNTLYRLLAAHSIGEKARGLSSDEKAQYALQGLLRFKKDN